MARIRVNHRQLTEAANKIDSQIKDHDDFMVLANTHVLSMDWSGDDSKQYRQKWDKLTANGSMSKNITARMKAYSAFLRFAAEQYMNAQADAVNRANKIAVG